MIHFLMNLLTACSHKRTTFPLTQIYDARRLPASGGTRSRTYVVCLDCGKEFAYNWREMRIEKQAPRQAKVVPERIAEPLQMATRVD
jgi:hypothetical protein